MSVGPPSGSARPVRISVAVYRLLLRLYPTHFRARFGRSMEEDFRRLCDDACSRAGLAGLGRAWTRAGRDLLRSVPGSWRTHWTSTTGGRRSRASRLEPAFEDVRWALRSLRRAPAFTLAATGVLALAIGGVATGFAFVDGYLLRGLPYPGADRLVTVSPPVLPYEASDPAVVEHPITWDLDAFTLIDGDRPELVRSAWISPTFEEVFGIEPVLGRGFGPADFVDGAPPVALLSHELWRRRYGADPDVLGRSVPLYASDRPDEAALFTIIGVLPRDFWYHNAYAEMLAPLRAPNPVYMARLRPGVPLTEAERTLTAAARRSGVDVSAEGIRLRRFDEQYVERVRPALGVLGASVSLVLLLAAANACVLLLVRAAGREGEFGVRRALGAARGRLARQLLAEGMLLAGGATLFGLALAALATGALAAPVEARLGLAIPGGAEGLGLSTTVVAVTLAASVLAGFAFGVAGLAGASGASVGAALGPGVRGGSGRRSTRRLRDVLVGAELALSLSLLVGAALALGSARHLATLDLGFEPRDRLTAQVNLRAAAYPDGPTRAAFFDRLADEAAGLPGVRAVGLVTRAPFGWVFNATTVEGERSDAQGVGVGEATVLAVGPGLLDALDVPLLRGRDLSGEDGPDAPRVAVVSERLAERLWPGGSAVGRRVRRLVPPSFGAPPEPEAWWTVVGVAGDVLQQLDGDSPDLWLPYAQLAPTSMVLVLHLLPGAASPIPALEEVLRRLDPEVAITAVTGLAEATMAVRAPSRFLAAVLGGFSLFALVLAVLGLYGVVSYAAARRSRDVALRMAMGARAGQVVRLFLRESVPVVASGLLVGMAGATVLTHLLASQLSGISPWHLPTWAGVAALLTGCAFTAVWLPARRAAAAEPATVLREEQ